MKNIMVLAVLIVSLSGCSQQTPEQFGTDLGRDAVLKDNDSLCYSAGWSYQKSKDSPNDAERRQNAATISIVRKELAFRKLKDDLMCARWMVKGQHEAAAHNAQIRTANSEQKEQEARAARAAAY